MVGHQTNYVYIYLRMVLISFTKWHSNDDYIHEYFQYLQQEYLVSYKKFGPRPTHTHIKHINHCFNYCNQIYWLHPFTNDVHIQSIPSWKFSQLALHSSASQMFISKLLNTRCDQFDQSTLFVHKMFWILEIVLLLGLGKGKMTMCSHHDWYTARNTHSHSNYGTKCIAHPSKLVDCILW